MASDDSTFFMVNDLVNDAGKTFQFRRRGGAITLWSGKDSLGVRLRP